MSVEPITLYYKDKKITLLPTAHVSKESAEMVSEQIDLLQPDCICVELDKDRYQSLKEPDKYRQTDIVKIIKQNKVPVFLVNLVLANYQRKMAKSLDSMSGKEMMIGISKSEELGAHLVLADRSVNTTFKRVWRMLTFKDKINLLGAVISAAFDDEEISEEQLAELQQSDMLNNAINEVSKNFPSLSEVLIVERDKYITHKIKNAPGSNIVAILGAAHTIGVQKYINEDYSIDEYDIVPPKKASSKIISWIIPAILVIAILASFSFDPENGLQQLKRWILINGTSGAIGALLAGAHPLAILVAFLSAPITSLNPLLACGWFAGLTQAHIEKPTVADFNSLSEDLNNWKGFWKNKVTRILLLVMLANLGSTLGTFISSLDLFKNLFGSL
ncbi:MAG: TraB/GumN family protein [Erysipelotrichaceae bacterium]|nr:TraB/GumN family protein [Erysipelotrichaceae bacterium]